MVINISDFQYGKFTSSQWELVIGSVGSSNVENINTYGDIEVFTDKTILGIEPYFYGTKLSEHLEFPMTIVNRNGGFYTSSQEQIIQGYLFNKKTPELLTISDWDKLDAGYMCLFTAPQKIKINNLVIGWTFNVKVMSQYSITSLKTEVINCTTDVTNYNYWNHSDINDYIYPDLKIQLASDVSFIRIENSDDQNRVFQLTGLRNGEEIYVNNKLKYFTTKSGDKILNKFNYNFFRVVDNLNRLRINGRSVITLTTRFKKAVGGF